MYFLFLMVFLITIYFSLAHFTVYNILQYIINTNAQIRVHQLLMLSVRLSANSGLSVVESGGCGGRPLHLLL